METTVNTNNQGFTLIEFLVAIVILMVGLLALLQVVNYAIIHNTTNQMRQEANILADEQMNLEKAKTFAQISSPKVNSRVAARLVNGSFRNFSVVKTNSTVTPSANTKNIDLQLSWRYKGTRYNHSVSSYVSQIQ